MWTLLENNLHLKNESTNVSNSSAYRLVLAFTHNWINLLASAKDGKFSSMISC